MTVLVTGATGFVGSAVVRQLIDAGYAVRAMVRRASDRRNLDGLAVELVEGNLTESESLVRAVHGCRGLFHVAADYRLWVPDRASMFSANVEGTRNLMQVALAAGVERIVYTSSVATLGIVPGGVADESTPVSLDDMIGPYKQSKFLAESAVRVLFEERSLPVVIVNPSTPIGPRDIKPTPTGKMVLDAAEGRIPAFVETGLNVVHVDDVARGHVAAFERGVPGDRYILGGENLTLSDILARIAHICGRRAPTIRLPHGAVIPIAVAAECWCRLFGGEPFASSDSVRLSRKRMFFSSDKATAGLGYTPRPVNQALYDALAYFSVPNISALAGTPGERSRPRSPAASMPTSMPAPSAQTGRLRQNK